MLASGSVRKRLRLSGVSFPGDSSDIANPAAASGSVPERPPTATQNATRVLPNDPELADVVAAWDRLPPAVRAGIVAMVKAAAGK